MEEFKYKAFISYSHKDRKWTRWLHRRMETYPIPKNIIGNVTSAGPIPRRLKPIFRDREELSASNNLGEKIQAALASSKNLIIICSPAAAQSKWVNQEILTFKQNNRDAQLFSVIVEGEPYASTMPGGEAEECFPPALRFEVNTDGYLSDTPAEPLAADLRPHADGKRLGFLKLLSGMIGVGLDEVVQRDMKRSRKRVTAITTGSLATVLAMGTLTGFALDARQEAEQRRNDAEGLIDFMLTDLRDKLEPVGRLDVLDEVATRALTYYEDKPETGLTCTELSGKARAHYLMTRILRAKHELKSAQKQANIALGILDNRAEECLTEPRFVINYAHAQQWAVENARHELKRNSSEVNLELLKPILENYTASMHTLTKLEKNETWAFEYVYEMTGAYLLTGSAYFYARDYAKAERTFTQAKAHIEKYRPENGGIEAFGLLDSNDKIRAIIKYADTLTWLADIEEERKNYKAATKLYTRSKSLYAALEGVDNPSWEDWRNKFWRSQSDYSLARLSFRQNDFASAQAILSKLTPEAQKFLDHDSENEEWKDFKDRVFRTERSLNRHIRQENIQ